MKIQQTVISLLSTIVRKNKGGLRIKEQGQNKKNSTIDFQIVIVSGEAVFVQLN